MMIQKGSANDVSLHRETGQVLETDDNLDFGDCYAGLVAVSDLYIIAIDPNKSDFGGLNKF